MNEDIRSILANQSHTKSKILFDVNISDPIPVNTFIYNQWLSGRTERECSTSRELHETVNGVSYPGISATLPRLLEETDDQYRNFNLLQTALEHPKSLASHSMFQMDPTTRKQLIEGYYDFDNGLMRELIGRKLTSGQRRDLDDTSEKLRIRLINSERQFDNLKRISRIVFGDNRSSSIDIIMNEFSLSRELAMKYVKVLFLCFHRFDLSHKRVVGLSTNELMKAAEIVMSNWGDPARLFYMELDIKLKEDVRDLKVYLSKESDKYWRSMKSRYQSSAASSVGQSPRNSSNTVQQQQQQQQLQPLPLATQTPPMSSITPIISSVGHSSNAVPLVPPLPSSIFQQQISATPTSSSSNLHLLTLTSEKIRQLESKFKSVLKGILAIGSNLSDSKEFRKLFEDIIEKVIDPLKRIDLTSGEVHTFFAVMVDVFTPEALGLTSLRHRDRVTHHWKSFLTGVKEIVTHIYDH
ncbi:hypothetical protein SAMD00019534_021550, partial [Acytostelium subglobosum LB1]|uniref:hypothetical protein n=1 Tax=Acytostelium subglobosum LB1 TaxID=1410327 RepID=UPI0006448513